MLHMQISSHIQRYFKCQGNMIFAQNKIQRLKGEIDHKPKGTATEDLLNLLCFRRD